MKPIVIILAICTALGSIATFASQPGGILGIWTTEGAKSQVEIFNCGQQFCARIVSLKDAVYTDPEEGPLGQLKTDIHNPDPAKRNQPLVGLQIMEGLTPDGEGTWANGTIYDPENGKTYKSKVTMNNGDRLNVRGFVGISLIGRTTVWTRKI